MGSRGPVPNHPLRLLTGAAARADRRPKPRTRPAVGGLPAPPRALSGAALAEWRRVLPLLAAEDLVSRLDRGVLAAYCLAWARLVAAEKALLDGKPLTTEGSHGGTIPRPEVRIATMATAQVAALADRLGLSPAGRARLGLVRPEKPRSIAEFSPELESALREAAGD